LHKYMNRPLSVWEKSLQKFAIITISFTIPPILTI